MTWETVPLGEVAKYVRGVTYKPADVVGEGEGGVACLRTKNIQSTLDLGDLVYVRGDLRHRAQQQVQANDVLVSSANSWHLVGRAVLADAQATGMLIGGFIGGLRFDPRMVDPRFGFRWFSSPSIQQTVRGFGQQTTNISNLNVDRTLRLRFPLPPLPEQRRIAAILDEADAVRASRARDRQLMNHAVDNRISSLIDGAVEHRPFGTLINEPLRNGISPSRSGNVEGDVLTLSAITRGSFDAHFRKRDTFTSPHSADKLVTAGLHLICRGNGNADLVGVMASAPETLEGVAFPDTMIATRPSSAVTSATLLAAWRHEYVREQIRRGARTTNGTYKVNQQLLASVVVPVPSIEAQRQIDELEAERAIVDSTMRSAATKMDALFVSLQYRAFRGEL
ncbi:restriction endonuclease subunit S [Microbacterium sp. NEAU-LLC]|uniref:Restriction endonuclease subunit S n=1 Tax=Microbacterium helvum TaxID=2773713 RepID=A0ABR8NN75_9MICO|nr:restriction endonuclease subunit S [Microbacterium helvum]MBD3942117.1 restriction endonuclease subunit S [Microbacterium helvum]